MVLCIHIVERTTIMLPAQLKHRAHRLAAKLGISMGELIRESLREALNRDRGDVEDPLYSDDASYPGPAPADLAADHDNYLYGKKP